MQYINHQTHTLYSGDRAHWRDIPVTSAPPDQWATPVVEDGNHVGWEPDQAAAQEAYRAAIAAHIDAVAVQRQYDNAVACATYRGDLNPLWDAEAVAFIAWRSDVWAYAFAELAKVMAGERDQPSIEALISELPKIAWPEA